jgi:hypothetical protein
VARGVARRSLWPQIRLRAVSLGLVTGMVKVWAYGRRCGAVNDWLVCVDGWILLVALPRLD